MLITATKRPWIAVLALCLPPAACGGYVGGGKSKPDRMTLLSVDPEDGSEGVDVGTTVILKFSMTPRQKSVAHKVRIRKQGGRSVHVYRRYAGNWVTITPIDPLKPGTTYVLVFKGKVKVDGYGRPMKKPEKVSFTTAAARSLAIAPARDVPPGDRTGHTATLLPSGEVLMVGGYLHGEALWTTEIFDPIEGNSVPGPPLPDPRAHHTATLLADGTVLIAGGLAGPELAPTDSVLIYDPTCEPSITPLGMLRNPRAFHTADLVEDGVVILRGGLVFGGGALEAYRVEPEHASGDVCRAGEGRLGQ